MLPIVVSHQLEKGYIMIKTIIAAAFVVALAGTSFAGQHGHSSSSFGSSFDATVTGGAAAAGKLGNAKSKAANENYAGSESSNKNGNVKTKQQTGSFSSSSSSAKNNGIAASASGGFAGAIGGATSSRGY